MKNKLKNREEENLKDLVNFAKSLDFDKYMQELEIKEALNLIKIKVNEEVEQEKLDQEIKQLIENENVDNKSDFKDDTNKIEDITKEEQDKKIENLNDNVSLFK